MSQLDLIRSHPWRRVAFTTYALSLAFFEAVVLDALLRGRGRHALILADVEGVRASLGELGARGAGRDYGVEPVAVSHGVFHPKITVLSGEDCHLMVGSGNLTFGGWGGNFELVEHLHPSFAAAAFSDAAQFFERLASEPSVRHGAGRQCQDIAEDLRTAARGQSNSGAIRLIHSLDAGLSEQIVAYADELGGATRMMVAAPYWDEGQAVSQLAGRLGLESVSAHVHPGGSARGTVANWPVSPSVSIEPVCIDFAQTDVRPLHAKAFEVLCKRGRLLISGSANATGAALVAGGNVEASVLRIQRERLVGWTLLPSTAPEDGQPDWEEDADPTNRHGVLRAVLEGDELTGQVLTPRMSGRVLAWQMTSKGPEPLGAVDLEERGCFTLAAPGLELAAWNAGRLVLRLVDGSGRVAEGFISIEAATAIVRRAGLMAPRLLSLIAGTETPADVAAIMEWLNDDPGRLAAAPEFGSGYAGGPDKAFPEGMFEVAAFGARDPDRGFGEGYMPSSASGWQRFVDHLLASLTRARPAFEITDDQSDEDGRGAGARRKAADGETQEALTRAQETMERLLETLLHTDNVERCGLIAFDLFGYMRQRLALDDAQSVYWLGRLAGAMAPGSTPADRTDDLGSAFLLLVSGQADERNARRVRATLRRLGVVISAAPPQSAMLKLFVQSPPSEDDLAGRWSAVFGTRTPEEHVIAYLEALRSDGLIHPGEALRSLAPEEWPTLEKALTIPKFRDKILLGPRNATACPRHGAILPVYEREKYRTVMIGRTSNCCDRVLMFNGDAA